MNYNEEAVAVLAMSSMLFAMFMVDLLSCVSGAGRFLMLKYGKQRNPWGYTLFAIALILSFANWLLLVLYIVDIADIGTMTTIQWDYDRFILVLCGTYLVCSVFLECIYFQGAYTFVFESNTSIDAGIYGFVDGFVRPFFYGFANFVQESTYCGIVDMGEY